MSRVRRRPHSQAQAARLRLKVRHAIPLHFTPAPAMIDMSNAASATVRVIGPVVSWRRVMGTTPTPLTSPTVGFRPTRPFSDAGARIEPSVSDPRPAAHRFAAAPAAGPALEPDGLRVGS